MHKFLIVLFLAFGYVACGAEPVTEPANGGGAEAAHDHTHTHNVKCGCVIEDVGACGNYVEIDGKYVPLVGDLGLGDMEFCKKTGLEADVEGEMKDGKFVATSFKYHTH